MTDRYASPEIGWMIARQAQRFGYASEAIAAAHGWAHTRWPDTETVCIISPENTASLKVASRFDYRREFETTYKKQGCFGVQAGVFSLIQPHSATFSLGEMRLVRHARRKKRHYRFDRFGAA
ncbi:GNAT family N-acetyltransferase [Paraburkholderia tropica]|uniref:GNAT family N-acetyltransferase n=1 Tax=Paraburkholderia tropica TaxID=92647 RepID=UPI0036F255D6